MHIPVSDICTVKSACIYHVVFIKLHYQILSIMLTACVECYVKANTLASYDVDLAGISSSDGKV